MTYPILFATTAKQVKYKPLQIISAGVAVSTDIEEVYIDGEDGSNSSSSSNSNSNSSNDMAWAPGRDHVMKITVDEAIDKVGTGGFQHRLLWAAGTCNGVNAMAVMVLSFIRDSARLEFDLTIDQSAWLTSSVFVGILVGTLIFGPLGDSIGRKPTFLVSSAMTAVCGVASAFAPTYWSLVLLRCGVGMGVGGTVIPFDTLAEFVPSVYRGSYLLYLGYFWTVGTSATPALAYYALQGQESWRLFVLLCAVPCVISSLFGFLWVPESPRWLMTQGKNDQALAILRHATALNNQDPSVVFPPGTHLLNDADDLEEFHSIRGLFLPQWRFMVICMLFVWAFLDFVYWGCIQVITLVFAEFDNNPLRVVEANKMGGMSIEDGEQFQFDYTAIVASSLAEILGQTAVLLLIDRIGRIPCQVAGYALGAITVFCLCMVSYIEDRTGDETERYVLILLAFATRAFIMSATSATWVHTAEMLPTQIRNTAHAVADALAGTGGALTPFVIASDNSMLMIGIVVGGITMLTAIFASMLPETRGVSMGTALSRSSSIDSDSSKAFTETSDIDKDIDTGINKEML